MAEIIEFGTLRIQAPRGQRFNARQWMDLEAAMVLYDAGCVAAALLLVGEVERRFPGGPGWYVIEAKHGRSREAIDELTARKFEIFAPVEKFYTRSEGQQWKGRRKKVVRLALGRYILVRITDDAQFQRALATSDVERFLPAGRAALPAEPAFVAALIAFDELGGFDQTSKAKDFDIGEKVKIACGPFTGAIGQLTRRRKNQRWDVALSYFWAGSGGKMEVGETEMELLEEEAA